MFDIIIFLATNPPVTTTTGQSDSVDVVARFMAFGGYIVTIGVFAWGRRGKIWRGRFDTTSALRPAFEEIQDKLAGAEQAPRNAELLWTIPVTAALAELRLGAQRIPDRKLCRSINELLKEVAAAKGDAPPSAEETEPDVPLPAARHAALKRAVAVAARISTRLDLIARKGATG